MMKSKFKAKLRWKYSVAVSDVQFPVFDPKRPDHEAEPIFVILATPAAYDAMIEAIAKASYGQPCGPVYTLMHKDDLERQAKVALAAIGINRRRISKNKACIQRKV